MRCAAATARRLLLALGGAATLCSAWPVVAATQLQAPEAVRELLSRHLPLADGERKEFVAYGKGQPIHATLAYHWARMIEMLYAAETIKELLHDDDIEGFHAGHARRPPSR